MLLLVVMFIIECILVDNMHPLETNVVGVLKDIPILNDLFLLLVVHVVLALGLLLFIIYNPAFSVVRVQRIFYKPSISQHNHCRNLRLVTLPLIALAF